MWKLITTSGMLISISNADFNENFGRSQAVTKLGRERMKIVFPKQKQGECTPKIVPVAKTYSKFETNWLVYYC